MSVSLVDRTFKHHCSPNSTLLLARHRRQLRDNPRKPRYGEGVTEAHQKLPALERAMKAVMVEKHQALLDVVCDVDANAGAD